MKTKSLQVYIRRIVSSKLNSFYYSIDDCIGDIYVALLCPNERQTEKNKKMLELLRPFIANDSIPLASNGEELALRALNSVISNTCKGFMKRENRQATGYVWKTKGQLAIEQINKTNRGDFDAEYS